MPSRNQFETNEEYNAWFRAYRNRDIEKTRAYSRKYNSEWRIKNGWHNEEKWKNSHPEKVKAQKAVQYAVKTGKLKKKPCAICDEVKTVGHHPDYNKPLEVIWLCGVHHRALHYSV